MFDRSDFNICFLCLLKLHSILCLLNNSLSNCNHTKEMKTDAMTRRFSVSYLRIADGAKQNVNLNAEHIYGTGTIVPNGIKLYIFAH